MITPDNKWQVIDAYLRGYLDATGRAEVEQKMDDDADFQLDVAMQLALNEQLAQEQRAENDALIDRLFDDQANQTSASTDQRTATDGPDRRWHPATPFWQRTWARTAAITLLLIGLGWLGYRQFATTTPLTLATTLTYEQRDFGATGIPDAYHVITYPVMFVADGTDPTQYSTDGQRLTLYLTVLPPNASQWRLRDNAETGGFLLTTPARQQVIIERNTGGERSELQP